MTCVLPGRGNPLQSFGHRYGMVGRDVPPSELKEIVQLAETRTGTMVRSGTYFTHSEWVEVTCWISGGFAWPNKVWICRLSF